MDESSRFEAVDVEDEGRIRARGTWKRARCVSGLVVRVIVRGIL